MFFLKDFEGMNHSFADNELTLGTPVVANVLPIRFDLF